MNIKNGYVARIPGTKKREKCDVCNTIMDVERNIDAPSSWGSIFSKNRMKQDCFTCPHRADKWHRQAYTLQQNAANTPSPHLAKIFLREASEVLDSRIPTKENW